MSGIDTLIANIVVSAVVLCEILPLAICDLSLVSCCHLDVLVGRSLAEVCTDQVLLVSDCFKIRKEN